MLLVSKTFFLSFFYIGTTHCRTDENANKGHEHALSECTRLTLLPGGPGGPASPDGPGGP